MEDYNALKFNIEFFEGEARRVFFIISTHEEALVCYKEFKAMQFVTIYFNPGFKVLEENAKLAAKEYEQIHANKRIDAEVKKIARLNNISYKMAQRAFE